MSFLARWDSQRHVWIVEDRKDGVTISHILTDGAFKQYQDRFRNGSETSFWKRLKALWYELDHTRYRWKEGVGIIPVDEY